jgi:hypothetical protein
MSMRRPLLPALALLGVLLPAAAAHAGSVGSSGTMRYEGGPGEANAVTITNTGSELVVRDSVPIEFLDGRNCRQDDPHTVVCPAVDPWGGPAHPYVLLGDGDDTFAWHGPGLPEGPNGEDTTVSGGAGDDVLTGADGPDSLDGGEGADRLAGGDGKDQLHGGVDGDRDAVDAGPGDDFVFDAEDVDAGPGKDFLERVGGGVLRLRDGAQDMVACSSPVAGLEADIRTSVGFPDGQDLVRGCHPPGTERAALKLLTTKRRFTITRRTKVIRLKFTCPAETRLVCETTDMSDLYSSACECGYEARMFRALPGETITVAFRPPKHDLRTLLHTLHWKRSLKGAIVWTSALDETAVSKQGVWIRFVGRR